MDQKENAIESMKEWLCHENEFGKNPAKIEIVDEFDLHDLHYYILKFKKSLLSSWLVGVCGGYERDNDEHCGHVYSEFKTYNIQTAKQDCVDMVEMIRDYWMNQADQNQSPEPKTTFVDFVLLKDKNVDLVKAFNYLREHWNIHFEPLDNKDKTLYVTNVNEATISLMLLDVPVPEEEADYYAQGCYMWEDAVSEVKTHQAHIIVSTLGKGLSTIDGLLLQNQLVDACMQLDGAFAVYGDEVVWPKHIFQDIMKDYLNGKILPIMLWVYLGIVTNDEGSHIYTMGLKKFGHYELETLPNSILLQDLHSFMYNVVCYIIEQNVTLNDGETIGMSETQKCQITLSDGLFLDEKTLKIEVVEEERMRN